MSARLAPARRRRDDSARALCEKRRISKPPKPPRKPPQVYQRPTPKVARLKRGKVLTAAEKAAFLASRPDLKKPT